MDGAQSDWWTYLMVDLRDPRADSFPGMYSVWPTLVICLAYYYIVKVWGPRFMKDREPYQIKNILVVYNLAQSIFSLWMFTECWQFYVTGSYSWHCQPVDYSLSPEGIRALNLAWWCYISKLIDLSDTFFFVARKKFDHISDLHVIHHGTTPLLFWWGTRFVAGGQSGFGPFLNSGIHTLMYLYYLLAACGPRLQPYLWWKKYLTTLQLLQFVLIFFHSLQPLIFDCNYPAAASLVSNTTGILYFILFMDFYRKTYSKAKAGKADNNNEKTMVVIPDTGDNSTDEAAQCLRERKPNPSGVTFLCSSLDENSPRDLSRAI
jgi:hypothetical protein